MTLAARDYENIVAKEENPIEDCPLQVLWTRTNLVVVERVKYSKCLRGK